MHRTLRLVSLGGGEHGTISVIYTIPMSTLLEYGVFAVCFSWTWMMIRMVSGV